MKLFFISFILIFSNNTFAQKIIGAAMADDKGITNNEKKAKYLIVLKKYSDTAYERLDYNFSGPMQIRAFYFDSSLSVLNGKYAKYSPEGYLAVNGQYSKNMKTGDWFMYDDTSHAIKKYVYHLDTLISATDLDSLSREKNKIKGDTANQHEAVYVGGNKKIRKIIESNIHIDDRTTILTKGGTTRIRFTIDTTGLPTEIEVLKSVEFAFDEESMRVISLLKDWIPASDKGIKLKAYRVLPITVSF